MTVDAGDHQHGRSMSLPSAFAVINQKGGVGKTTVTLGLASAALAAGDRVLVVDLDPQASATWVLGADPATVSIGTAGALERHRVEHAIVESAWSSRVHLLPASPALQHFEAERPKRLRRALRQLPEGEYDAVLIDCPPSGANLTTSALTAARHALVVVEPSSLGLRGLGTLADAIDQVWDEHNPDLELSGVILNRVPTISAEAERRIAELADIVGSSAIWDPPIPQRVVLNQAVGERRPVHAYGARASDTIAAFDRLWAQVTRLATPSA
jgi:chromosome partitioning protein